MTSFNLECMTSSSTGNVSMKTHLLLEGCSVSIILGDTDGDIA